MNIQTILSSIALHTTVFLAGGALLVAPVQYGVESGIGGVDIDLIAAPLAEAEEAVVAPEPVIEEVPAAEAEFVEPAPMPAQEVVPVATPVAVEKPATVVSDVRGDGSSANPGKDATTFRASSGALAEAKPKYLRNPAPIYPSDARQRGEQGLVLLAVHVDMDGKVKDIFVKQSSGYEVLDESALKAVRKWKFEPARMGAMRLESRVEVPVRFQLDKAV